jgi:hypothetical protein
VLDREWRPLDHLPSRLALLLYVWAKATSWCSPAGKLIVMCDKAA